MLCCEYCEIFKNTHFEELLQTTASKILQWVYLKFVFFWGCQCQNLLSKLIHLANEIKQFYLFIKISLLFIVMAEKWKIFWNTKISTKLKKQRLNCKNNNYIAKIISTLAKILNKLQKY